MIPSAAAQHRSKHFDQLLARELAFIERGHEQNLLTYEKLERSIRRDRKRTLNIKRNKFSLPPINEHSSRQSELSRSSFASSTTVNQQSIINDKLPAFIPKFHRQCYKPYRLPPIVKPTRPKQSKNDLHWLAIDRIQTANNQNEIVTFINEEIPKKTLLELTPTPIEQQIHSFMETLPIYKGVHKGFDNFAPAALHSNRTPVSMR
jgi:hypothetical protein